MYSWVLPVLTPEFINQISWLQILNMNSILKIKRFSISWIHDFEFSCKICNMSLLWWIHFNVGLLCYCGVYCVIAGLSMRVYCHESILIFQLLVFVWFWYMRIHIDRSWENLWLSDAESQFNKGFECKGVAQTLLCPLPDEWVQWITCVQLLLLTVSFSRSWLRSQAVGGSLLSFAPNIPKFDDLVIASLARS